MKYAVTDFSDEQLAGQRLMVGFEGTGLNPDLRFLIDTLKVGGLVLFSGNIETPEQVRDLSRAAQDHARACGQPPLIIAVDQEGGEVARLRAPFTEFSGNPSMAEAADAERFARITAAELSGVGINMNLAPVLDVAPPDLDSIMAGRVFSGSPERVARFGTVIIDRLQADGVMAVAKHFPGIGRTTLDSHLDLPVLDVEPDALESDLIPFQAAVRCGVAGVMLSHIRYPGLDPEWPASLSTVVARDLLRRRFGYGGLIMTDDLDMGAIQKHFDIPTACGRIFDAGIDFVLICHKGLAIETAFGSILDLQARSAAIKIEGAASVHRILAMKKKFIGD